MHRWDIIKAGKHFNIVKICPPYCASVWAFHLSWILPQLVCESINAKAQTLLSESLSMSTCLYILRDLSHHVSDALHNIINSQVSLQILAQDDVTLFKNWFSYWRNVQIAEFYVSLLCNFLSHNDTISYQLWTDFSWYTVRKWYQCSVYSIIRDHYQKTCNFSPRNGTIFMPIFRWSLWNIWYQYLFAACVSLKLSKFSCSTFDLLQRCHY